MSIKNNLLSLEIMRAFVKKVVPVSIYMQNLVIANIETPNKRLWALRESMKMAEPTFAELFNTSLKKYHQYEKSGNSIPLDFLEKVANKFSISLDWLLCKSPMLPMPQGRVSD